MAKLRFIADRGVHLPSYFLWDDAISKFCKTEDFAFLADRFGYLNQFTRIDAAAIDEGKFPSSGSVITFDTCMVSRAADIARRCSLQGCNCYVLWSGGCDSTGVVAALIDAGMDRRHIKVLYTKSSTLEFPEFMQFMTAASIETIQVSYAELFSKALVQAADGDLVVTGFPADQLFGSIIGQLFPGDTTKTHWTEYLKSDKANQQYEAAFEYYGLPVKTVAEFLWFNNFALKWDYVCYPGLMMVNKTHHNIIPFYNTPEFQAWSVSNFDILHRYDQKDPTNYKVQMKDYIFSVTKLQAVYSLKKVPSLAYAAEAEALIELPKSITLSGIDDAEHVTTVDVPIKSQLHTMMGTAGLAAAQIMRRYLKK